jgi:transposase
MEGKNMARLLLSDNDWKLIEDVFPEPAPTGRPPRDPRVIVNAILWVLRTGAPWRDLPEEFGPWQTAWRLFDRWTADGTWDTMLRRLQSAFVDMGQIDAELWCIDGTVVRAHRCAAGGGKKGARKRQRIMH